MVLKIYIDFLIVVILLKTLKELWYLHQTDVSDFFFFFYPGHLIFCGSNSNSDKNKTSLVF